MTIHEIALAGYKATYAGGKCLYLGTKESYGNEQLHLTLDNTWSELAIAATFTNATGESTTVPMEAGNLVTVPPEAAETATSRFRLASVVFKGTVDGVQVISGDLPYIVEDHAPADGENSIEPTPDQYAQFVAAVKADADRAEEAAARAEETTGGVAPDAVKDAVAEYLDANPVETTPIDATLTRSGQAADAAVTGEKIKAVENSVAALGGSVATIEPAEDDIPKAFLDGDVTDMSKDNEKVLSIAYRSKTKSFDGFVKMKWQGNSSLQWDKHNFTIKLYEDEEVTTKKKVNMKGWGEQNKFCLKSDWIDLTHSRNVVCARLWSQVVASRSDVDKTKFMTNSPNNGAIDGFPIKVYINGVYQGLYNWNIPKDAWMFAMDEDNPDHCVLCAEQNNNGNNDLALGSEFRAECALNGGDWSVEIPDAATDEVKIGFNNLVSFVMNATDDEFKGNLGNYANVQSLLDYFAFMIVICGLDSAAKNMLMVTENGGSVWYASMYDMDVSFGQEGQQKGSATRVYPDNFYDTNSLLWERLIKCFAEELKANYIRLRGSVLSWQNIFDAFENYIGVITAEMSRDQAVYPPPGTAWNSLDFIETWTKERLAYTDTYFATLGEETGGEDPNEPDEPGGDEGTEIETVGAGDLYSLSEAITSDGTNGTGVNTGVKPNSGAPDITLIVDFQLTAAAAQGKTLVSSCGAGNGPDGKGLAFYYSNTYLCLAMQYGYVTSITPDDLTRHKVAASFNRSEGIVKIYVDGVLNRTVNNVGEVNWLEDNENTLTLLGLYNATHGTASCLNGTIYHCDLYSGVLTDEQIIAKMASYG